MSMDSSASPRDQEPHPNQTTGTATIINALKRRAQSVVNDRSIDYHSRALVRYALETNDPWLADLVRRADAGERIDPDAMDFSQPPDIINDDATQERIETLAEIICRGGDEPAAALLLLMVTLENDAHPKALANQTKHHAFAWCAESNLYGIVDAQIPLLENELLTSNSSAS